MYRLRFQMLLYAIAAIAISALVPLRAAHAQYDVRSILVQVIKQLQTGTPDPGWYGIELWQTIAVETGSTGVYPQLVQLGAVKDVVIIEQLPLPTGTLYGLTAQHQNGSSTWVLGISTLTNRIEYAEAQFNGAVASLPDTEPEPEPEPDAPNPPANAPPQSADNSAACQKFPNLCD